MPFKCELGFHDWNRAYLSTDSCKIGEKCSQCGAVKGQVVVKHKWEWIERNPCLSQQVCKRCGAIGQIDEKEHQWKEIYKPNSYEIQRTCESCGNTSTNSSGFSKFIGQEGIKPSLMILVAAGRQRGETLEHMLLSGQSGMGKVTLAKIIAAEMRANTKISSGKTIEKAGDFAAILTNLRAGDFLIIEQIESMRKQVLEVLVPAMEDFILEITVGKGFAARNIKLKLPRFTVVGTTSKLSQLDERVKSQMFSFSFTPYNKDEIGKIISLCAMQQGIIIEMEATNLLVEQCNGCPGEALLVLKKVHKYAIACADGQITSTIARDALAVFGSNKNSPDI